MKKAAHESGAKVTKYGTHHNTTFVPDWIAAKTNLHRRIYVEERRIADAYLRRMCTDIANVTPEDQSRAEQAYDTITKLRHMHGWQT